jgi:hypothetical protein
MQYDHEHESSPVTPMMVNARIEAKPILEGNHREIVVGRGRRGIGVDYD